MNKFEDANNELNELIECDIFGENVKEVSRKFGQISDLKYYCESLDLWLKDDEQFGKENVKEFIKVFFNILNNAMKKDVDKTINEVTMFFKGDNISNRAETISSYTEYMLAHRTFIEEIDRKCKEEKNIKNAKQVSNALVNAYSKGVEYVSKIYTLIDILFRITDEIEIDINNINKKTLYEKCKDIKNRKVPEYNLLVDSIDRNVRNAEAHLNISYNLNKEVYIYKVLVKGRWKYIEVSAIDMIFKIYPQIGWIIQGFIYSISLIIIAFNDKNKYIEYLYKIFK